MNDCDLIAKAYSEGWTLAKGLADVHGGDADGGTKYKQFFLLVFDFASPAYGSEDFNATFAVSPDDLASGTLAYLIAPIGSLKFAEPTWSLDAVNYLDYPADEPGGKQYFARLMGKFYPRLRFYRAVAHEAKSDPLYDLADLHHEVARLRDNSITKLIRENVVAWAGAFALLMVLAWRWWASRRMADEYQNGLQRMREEQLRQAQNQERILLESRQAMADELREKQAALDAEKEKYKFLLESAVCIPDAPIMDRPSESA